MQERSLSNLEIWILEENPWDSEREFKEEEQQKINQNEEAGEKELDTIACEPEEKVEQFTGQIEEEKDTSVRKRMRKERPQPKK